MINRVVLVGRLTRDPELRYTQNGVAVTTFTLAVNRTFTNAQGEREADFINIVAWRQLAELCANYLNKGSQAGLDGRLQTRTYDNKEGRRIFMTEVIADNVQFLTPASERKESSASSSSSKGSDDEYGMDQTEDPFANEGKKIDISDDDLPF